MLAQILSVIIFLTMFVMIVREDFERQWITLAAGSLTLILVYVVALHDFKSLASALNLGAFVQSSFWYQLGQHEEGSFGINWATIVFIAGMMVMVEGMAESGFFRWLCMRLAKAVHFRTFPLFMVFMVLSAVLSMFIDSITVILFLAAVTVELSRLLKFDTIPIILAEIFCANLGGSATMCGDPPNVIIGTRLGYTFFDFLYNTGEIAGICMIVALLYFGIIFKMTVKDDHLDHSELEATIVPKDAITNQRSFIVSTVIFSCIVVLLITHAQTGLTVSSIGCIAALFTVLAQRKSAKHIIKRVDYKTLLFFIGLFVVVSGLEVTGILEIIAGFIQTVSGGNVKLMLAIILFVSAIASAFIDNIPFAATMIPVIKAISASTGIHLDVLAWTLALGTDIGGSATPIGASANVVGVAIAQKNGHPISWGRYCKLLAPITILVMVVSIVCIYVKYF